MSTSSAPKHRAAAIACGFDQFATYAAKSHPELAPPGGFAVTYNVNLANGTLETAERAAEEHDAFYVPQFVAGVLPSLQRKREEVFQE